MRTELQRIANVLGINTTLDDNRLCLLIQDKIKEKDKQVKEKTFKYHMEKAQKDRLKSEIHNLKSEYAESIGIHEHMMVKKSRDTIKKELNKALEENYKLRKSIELYRANDLKDKLKEIEGVR
jgi:hypothetical protein